MVHVFTYVPMYVPLKDMAYMANIVKWLAYLFLAQCIALFHSIFPKEGKQKKLSIDNSLSDFDM